jgi:antitoxin CptB
MSDAEKRHHSRLRWRCRRGMRELDVLLVGFLERDYPRASLAERQGFERLLEMPDPLIMAYLTGRETVTEPALADVVARLTARQD